MIKLRSGSATDVGRMRSKNEDTPLTKDGLYAVADGMGGHHGGEVASHLAVETLANSFNEPDADLLREAVQIANEVVYLQAADDPDLRGMGTTLCAIAPVSDDGHDTVAWVHVGDSRIYLFHDGDLTQLTEDHTLVEEMVRDGRIAPEEARSHPQRNIVTRALGIDHDVLVDAGTVDPYEGDRFLLCSDGLFNEVDESRIAATLRRLADPDEAAAELVRLANEHGGRDNITVVVVDLDDDGGAAEAASAAVADREGTVESGVQGKSDESGGLSRSELRAAKRAERGRVVTWRVAVFGALFVVILVLAASALGYYARRTYYVGFNGDQVAVFKGKPGGVLWFEPTLEGTTRIERDDVPAARLAQLEEGREVSDLDEAEDYLKNLEAQIERQTPTTTTTTTATTLPGATTTVP